MNTLTERQRQVARMVADGRTNRQIADLLYVNEGTIKNHLSRIATTIGVAPGGSRCVHVARWVWEQENPRTNAENRGESVIELTYIKQAGPALTPQIPALTPDSEVTGKER